jgi:potassium uptake TrkH family protein
VNSTLSSYRRRLFRANPPRVVALFFALAVLAGSLLLMLPSSTGDGQGTSWVQALFTATSAVCVTGLTVVDTGAHWSALGEIVILALIQLGGLGIMTLASTIVLVLNRKLGVASRLVTQTETGSLHVGEVRPFIFAIVRFSLAFEAIGATILTFRFLTAYDYSVSQAVWHGIFHSVSAFNNAGFGLRSDNMTLFVEDWWVNGTIGALIVFGGLGFPVMLELLARYRTPRRRRQRLSLHSRITLAATAVLIVAGTIALSISEWTNPATFGSLSTPDSILAAAFHSIQTRTAGFNTVDIGAMNPGSWLIMSILMFIGGGSASTAGGIKVTTFTIIALMIWAEIRGERDVTVFGRRLGERPQRQAIALAALALGACVTGGLVLVSISGITIDAALFEAISAFGTVGLSTGITAGLDESSQLVLVGLMYLGRLGPLTLGAALVLRSRTRLYRYPEEQPIIG